MITSDNNIQVSFGLCLFIKVYCIVKFFFFNSCSQSEDIEKWKSQRTADLQKENDLKIQQLKEQFEVNKFLELSHLVYYVFFLFVPLLRRSAGALYHHGGEFDHQRVTISQELCPQTCKYKI